MVKTSTGISLCFFLSGLAALLYQTAWMRQFSIVFGTSELAVVTVLAAYMGGLALGAAIAGRVLNRIHRPVLIYGFLEGGIALFALAVPLFILVTTTIYIALFGNQANPVDASGLGQTVFYLCAAFLILLVPTAFMGATLPLLLRHRVTSNEALGRDVSWLYAINTAGAVAGTLIAAYILLPVMGLNGTVWSGVLINGLIFLIAGRLARDIPVQQHAYSVDAEKRKSWEDETNTWDPIAHRAAWILPLMLISGAVSFYLEVLWTRLINHVLGGSVYAFASMLAAFLTGITLGSALAGRFAQTRQQAAIHFSLAQLGIALSSVITFTFIESVMPETRGLLSGSLLAIMAMLPATFFIGATFPLAVRIFAKDETSAGKVTARIYTWNTIGAISGAILAGFYLIPFFGFEGSVKLLVLINISLAALSLLLVADRQYNLAGACVALFILCIGFYQPQRPDKLLNASVFETDVPGHTVKEVFFSVGRSSDVMVLEQNEWMSLRTNGLPEASITAKGAPPTFQNQRWLTALPVAARPDADAVLIVGFGGGVALEGIADSVEVIDVIELEPQVIEANKAIGAFRDDDPLKDPRLNIIINDARNALNLTDRIYDIIVSQPSHPWTAGASHLFTREFMQLAKDHLNESGVFVQWMSTLFVDEELLRILAATITDVFDNVRVYQPDPGVLLFLGSNGSLEIEKQINETGRPLSDHPLHYAYLGLNSIEDFLVALTLDETGVQSFAQGAEISTDNKNYMAVNSRSFQDGVTYDQLIRIITPFDPLLSNTSWIYEAFADDLNIAYIGNRLIHKDMKQRAVLLSNALEDRSTAALIRSEISRYQGSTNDALKWIEIAINQNPDNINARYALVRHQLAALAQGKASIETLGVAASLDEVPAAVVQAWGHAADKSWNELSDLDHVLAQSDPTDLWYPIATQLRVEWRTKVTSEQFIKPLTTEGLQLIDRAIMIEPGLDLYMLRASCGYLLQDPYIFMGSVRKIVSFFDYRLSRTEQGDYMMTDARLASMKRLTVRLQEELNTDLLKPIRDRTGSVIEALQRLTERMDNLP